VGVSIIKTKSTIYGIKNCDTMKKARAFLDKAGVEYAFHDYKTAGIERASSKRGRKNSAGKSCSTAPARLSANCPTRTKTASREAKAIALMLAQPSMIKRPVLDLGGGKLLVGFVPGDYKKSIAA
jgi:arsenate reductase